MYPMKLIPIYKDYLWGGQNLKTILNKYSPLDITAESWELSCYKGDYSLVANGIYQGQSLNSIIEKNSVYVTKNYNNDRFPILIKFIDAASDLSIQVHPSNETARNELGESGKAEMWYVISAEKESYIYYGLNRIISKEEVKEKIEDGTICEVLNRVYVQPGDVFYIMPGIIHAIGAGCVIAEVQQSSDTTFRLYDYNRTDAKGNKRELHINRAIEVIDYRPIVPNKTENNDTIYTDDFKLSNIFECDYFKVAKINSKKKISLQCSNKSFQSLLFVEGKGYIKYNEMEYKFEAGDSYFIPAGIGTYEINGSFTMLMSSI